MTEQDMHYLRSILNNLREFRVLANSTRNVSALGTEVLADNIDWLDCFIDKHKRAREKNAHKRQASR
jgi:hypothetical protein